MIEVQAPNGAVIEFPDGTDAATIDRAMRQFVGEQQPSTGMDVAKSFGVGVGQAALGAAGMGGDIRQAASAGVDWAANKLGLNPENVQAAKDFAFHANRVGPLGFLTGPTTRELTSKVEDVTGPFYEPQTVPGEYARTTGQFAAGAAMPGGLARRIVGGVMLPAFASETAGQLTKGKPYEPVARVAGALAGGAAGATRMPRIGATARATDTLADMMTPQTTQRLQELGPEAFLFEGNPTLTQVAQGVVQRPGAAAEQLRTAVTGRHATTPARLQADIQSNFGPSVAPSRVDARITQAQRDLNPAYRAAVQNPGPAHIQPILMALGDDIAREAGGPRQTLERIRQMFYDRNRLKTSTEELFNIRNAIDDLTASIPGDQAKTRGLTGTYRQAVDDAIRATAPAVKTVDARFSSLAGERDALNRGQTVLRSGPEATRPSDLAREMATMTPAQQAALRMGTRADIERVMGNSIFDVNALRNHVKADGRWNHQKLAQIFGQAEADRVMAAVEREVAFRRAYDGLIANSQTAPRQVAEQATRVAGPGNLSPEAVAGAAGYLASGGNPVAGLGAFAATGATRNLWSNLAAGGQTRLDRALVERLGSTGTARDALVQALLDHQRRRAIQATPAVEAISRALLAAQGASVGAR